MVSGVMIAVVTGVIAFLSATWIERMRWRRAAAGEAAQRALASRRAVRLVERELFEAEQRIVRAVRAGHYSRNNRVLATREWDEHRGVISTELGVADWHLVGAAYDAIIDLNERLDERLGSVGPPTDAGQALVSGVAEMGLSRVRDGDQLQLRWRAIRTASWILRAQLDEAEKVSFAWAEDERLAAELWPREVA